MTDARLNEMVIDLKCRYGYISKNQRVQHLMQVLADSIKSKRDKEEAQV
jgi:hypothetical protein